MALLELAAYPIILKATGCSSTEVLFSFTCGEGWVGHSIAIVLNLPALFSYAREFTFSAASAPLSREYVRLLYLFDVIFILALTYPLLLLFGRKSDRRSS
jgi:putative flippase GtrA